MVCSTIRKILSKIRDKRRKHERFAIVHAYDRGVLDGLDYSIMIINEEMDNNGKENQR